MEFKPGDGVKYIEPNDLCKEFLGDWGLGPFVVTGPSRYGGLHLATADGKDLTHHRSVDKWTCTTDHLVKADFELAVYRRRHGASKDGSAAAEPGELPCVAPVAPVEP